MLRLPTGDKILTALTLAIIVAAAILAYLLAT